MEAIGFDRVVSVNSETKGHGSEHLLSTDIGAHKSWQCEKGTEKGIVILQLSKSTTISSVHVGNANSAFVEVLVGRASDTDEFQSLVPMSIFMNPTDSKTNKKPNQVRFFHKTDLNQQTAAKPWDRVKLVCSQPFNKQLPFGVCFIKVFSDAPASSDKKLVVKDSSPEATIEIGSFFKKRKDTEKRLSVTEQIREAEKPSSLTKHTPLSTEKIKAKIEEKKTPRSQTKQKQSRRDDEEEEEERSNRKNKDLGLEDTLPKKRGGDRSRERKIKDLDQEATSPKRKRGDGSRERNKKDLGLEDTTPKKRRRDESSDRKERNREKEQKEKEKDLEEQRSERPRRGRTGHEGLMADVVFVISGFKNPLRGQLRDQALQMGAKYRGDWDDQCTHLICAYNNTPKFNQVKGKGKIVRKEWVEDCHREKARKDWRPYSLEKDSSSKPVKADKKAERKGSYEQSTDEDVDEGQDKDKTTKGTGTVAPAVVEAVDDCEAYNAETDEEELVLDTTKYALPYLPNIFTRRTFCVADDVSSRATIERYIVAYDGIITETLNEDVEFFITNRGGQTLEIFHKKAPNFVALKPSWIWEVNSQRKWVSTAEFIVK